MSKIDALEEGLDPSYEFQVFAWSGILADKTEVDGRHIVATKDHGDGIVEIWHKDIPDQ